MQKPVDPLHERASPSPSKASESEKAAPGQTLPEVTPEFLATLPKGTKIRKVTLPSDRKFSGSETRESGVSGKLIVLTESEKESMRQELKAAVTQLMK